MSTDILPFFLWRWHFSPICRWIKFLLSISQLCQPIQRRSSVTIAIWRHNHTPTGHAWLVRGYGWLGTSLGWRLTHRNRECRLVVVWGRSCGGEVVQAKLMNWSSKVEWSLFVQLSGYKEWFVTRYTKLCQVSSRILRLLLRAEQSHISYVKFSR